MNELVSVIIPVYNAAGTILESIASVQQQTYGNWEIILVDDGSTDQSPELLAALTDPRIKVFSQQNQGVAIARNTGISKAAGAYIAFLDADDLWFPQKLEQCVQALESGDYALVYSEAMEFSTVVKNAELHPYTEAVVEADDYLRLLMYDYIGTLTVVVKKQVLDKTGLFDPQLYGTEDWDLWIRIAKDHQIIHIDEPLCYYRLSPGGLSHNRDKHLKEELKVLQKHVFRNREIPQRIRTLARWIWLKKTFYNHIIKKRYLPGIIAYAGMWLFRPFSRENLFFLRRRNG